MSTGYVSMTFKPGQEKLGHIYVWELPVRITHWVMAVSIPVLFVTGMFIATPIVTSFGQPYRAFLMGRVRQVHFIAGYALLFALVVRFYWYFAGNKYARSGLPCVWRKQWWKAAFDQVVEYMGSTRGPTHMGHNVLAGFSYVFMVGGLSLAEIVTGFALYGESNPGGFWDRACGWVIPLMGGSFRTHTYHHLFAWGLVVFTVAHLYLVLFGSLRYKNGLVSSIVSGDKFFREGDEDE